MNFNSKYGIDAPNLVLTFFIAGIGLMVLSAMPLFLFGNQFWPLLFTKLFLLLAAYPLGMGCFMLYTSLISKVRGREALLDLVKWSGSEQVLDVGCGRGLLLIGAAHRLTTGHATGVDLWIQKDQNANAKSATLHNALVEGVENRVSVETADMRTLPFANASIDVIVSSWAVHNLEAKEDRLKALAEMARVLKPSGTIILNDIVNRFEYRDELQRLGFKNTRIITGAKWKDFVSGLVSFGSFMPATVLALR